MKKETYIFFCGNVRDASTARPSCGGACMEELYEYCKKTVKEKKQALLDNNNYVKVNKTGCLGKCEQGPNMVFFPENRWYQYTSKEDIDNILQKHDL
jgi:(2Fe-2S) ferredoxin